MTAFLSPGQLCCNSAQNSVAAFYFDKFYLVITVFCKSVFCSQNSSTLMTKGESYTCQYGLLTTFLFTLDSPSGLSSAFASVWLITDDFTFLFHFDCTFLYFHFCQCLRCKTEMKLQLSLFQKASFYVVERNLNSTLEFISYACNQCLIVYNQNIKMPHQQKLVILKCYINSTSASTTHYFVTSHQQLL